MPGLVAPDLGFARVRAPHAQASAGGPGRSWTSRLQGPPRSLPSPQPIAFLFPRVSLDLEEGGHAFSGTQGEAGASAPEPKEGEDLLGEGGSVGVDGLLADSVGEGHPAHLVVQGHPYLPGLLL